MRNHDELKTVLKIMGWLLIIMVLPVQTAQAAIIRGPYLQNGTTEGVTIMWRTDTSVSSKVSYGTSLGTLNQTVSNTSPKTDHTIRITGLKSASKYFYQVGTTSGTVLAGGDSTHYFVTSPAVGSTEPVRFWALGDSGQVGNDQIDVKNAYLELAANEKEADFWLMLGDDAYNSGTDTEFQNALFNTYPEILRNKVLWSAIGNHEEDLGVYYGVFDFPTQGQGGGVASGTEHYYSFDYANIHFICLNSEQVTYYNDPCSIMYQWLRKDLADTTQEWIIAFWHQPPYSKGSHDSDDPGEVQIVKMREYALPILEAGGVDLVLIAHSHNYERSYFMNGHYGNSSSFNSNTHVVQPGNGREDGDGAYIKTGANAVGTVYIVSGGGGGTLGTGSLNHPAMLVGYNQFGSMIIDVNDTRMDIRYLRECTTPIQIDDYLTIKSEKKHKPH